MHLPIWIPGALRSDQSRSPSEPSSAERAEGRGLRSQFASIALLTSVLALQACGDPDERYDAGYDDGYAVGYNTTCEIRTTLIEGDFDNEFYSKGYEAGYAEGARACRQGR